MDLIGSTPWLTLRWLHRRQRRIASDLIDRALGVATTFDELVSLRGGDPRLFATKPTGWLPLYLVLRSLRVGPGDVMVDIGSGAGRALLVASRLPFDRIVGVELLPAMHALASRNLAGFRLRRRAPVELVQADATAYPLPDDATVLFFYNSFDDEPFRRLMAGVFASLGRRPRRLRLVYVNPKEHDWLIATGRCRLYRVQRGWRPTRQWARMLAVHFYEVTGGPSAISCPSAAAVDPAC